MVTFILLIIGGLNWLLIGLGGFDLVAYVFGSMTIVSKIIYTLVGVSAVYELFTHKKNCKCCDSAPKMTA